MGAVLHGKICKSCHVSSSFSHGHSHGGGHGHSHNGDVGGGHGHSHNSGAQSYSRSRSRFANRQHINASGSTDDDDCLLVPGNDSVATDPFGQYVTGSPDSIDDVLICNADDRNCNVPLQPDSSARHGAVPQPTTEETNINVRAAMIHVIGDFIQSVGVLVAALIIHFAGDNYKIADPICTFVFSFLVLCTTLYILRDILLIIMEGVPLDVDYLAMKKDLEQLPGVRAVHSLNAWSLTVGKVAVGVHLAVGPDVEWQSVLTNGTNLLYKKYKVQHSTIQVESYDESIMTVCARCRSP